MRALLLAAGEGTRLRPLTEKLPKCLVPLAKKPLLAYWLEHLSEAGIEAFLINTHYLAEQVEEFVLSSPYKQKISLVYEKKLLNTAGTILKNRSFFQEEPFLLVHADNLSFCDFKAFFLAHEKRPKESLITMMTFESDTPSSCGVVTLDERGIVQKFYEKVKNPPSNLANGAVYICEPSVIEFIASLAKEEVDFSLDVLPAFMGKIFTYKNDMYHRDIGTPQSYAQAQKDILNFIE